MPPSRLCVVRASAGAHFFVLPRVALCGGRTTHAMSLSVLLMGTLVGRVGAARSTIAVHFVPVVAIALGVTLRDGSNSPAAVAGTVLFFVSAWVASRKET